MAKLAILTTFEFKTSRYSDVFNEFDRVSNSLETAVDSRISYSFTLVNPDVLIGDSVNAPADVNELNVNLLLSARIDIDENDSVAECIQLAWELVKIIDNESQLQLLSFSCEKTTNLWSKLL